jgi:hypothetical protein
MNMRSWLVRLYPHVWRERFGDEFEVLLQECLHSPLDVLDVFLGALDAHLELPYETNWRLTPALALARSAGASVNMVNKLRSTVLFVFAAFIAFIVAGFSLTGLMDDSQLVPLTRSNPALFVSYTTIEIGSVFGLLAIVIGGAPLAWTIIRRTFTSQRKDLGLLFVPLISFLALVIYFLVMVYLAFNTSILSQPTSSTGHALMWGLITIFIVGAIASTAAVWKLISRTEMEQETFGLLGKFTTIKLYEFAFTPAVVAALSMLVMFLATVIWGWLSYSLRPDLFTANMGVLMTSTLGSFAFTLITMVAAVIVAFIGVARGYSSRKAGSS